MDLSWDAHRVYACEAALAEAIAVRITFPACLKHSLCADEGQGVGSDLLADLLHIMLVGDKLVPARGVDAELSWELNRWRCYAEMHFLCSGTAQDLHQTAACGTTYN